MHIRTHTGLIRRLLRDTSANTLAIAAAAVIPLIGVIGGGVDVSRMYMAKSRLQQACDSATLAARKKLTSDDAEKRIITAEVEQTADNFFDANFQTGAYGTKNTDYTVKLASGTQLDGVARTSIPTTLMAVFGFKDVAIDVKCSADLNLPNIDIVLVLDNSGSMRNSRMVALKEAVFGFYDEIMAVKPADARVRIGIVPYNASVNVGDMVMDLNPDYIADRWTYQSREPKFRTEVDDPGDPGSPGENELLSNRFEWLPKKPEDLGSTNFSGNAADNDYRWRTDASQNLWGEDDCENDYPGSYRVGGETWVISNTFFYRGVWGNTGDTEWRSACAGRVKKYKDTPPVAPRPPTYKQVFDHYEYKPIVFDTSLFKQGGLVTETFAYVGGRRVPMPTGPQGTSTAPSRWNKCIEEATTVATTNFNPIPAGANDLNIDLVPSASDPDTQWRPSWRQVTYDRVRSRVLTTTSELGLREEYCIGSRAWPLQEYDTSGSGRNRDFENRINGMVAEGWTMHDIGMIWAGRIISPDGIFAATNETAPNGEPISRHVIFMTDGEAITGVTSMNSYGNYDMDGRFAGFAPNGLWTNEQITPIHNARLAAVCAQVKNKNITMWTVTFGLSQNSSTRNCASGDSRAFEADDRDELINNFRKIATNIAELRLVE